MSRPYGATLYQKVEIFDILGPHSHSPNAIEVKFCTAKRTHVHVGPAKFDMNWCNELPLLGEKPDFWPVSKFNTSSLPLRGILLVIRQTLTKDNTMEHTHSEEMQDRQKFTFHSPTLCLPNPVHTCRNSASPEGPLGGRPSLSLSTKGSWVHLGKGLLSLLSAL